MVHYRESRARLAGWGSSLYASSAQDERLQIPFGLRKPGIRHGTHLRYELMAQGTGQLHHACCARLLRSLHVYLLLSSFFYDTRDRGVAMGVWGRLRCPGALLNDIFPLPSDKGDCVAYCPLYSNKYSQNRAFTSPILAIFIANFY